MGDGEQHIEEPIVGCQLRDTFELAKRLMAGRRDWKGRPYYFHDVEVMGRLPSESTDAERKAALLHSVLDTGAATPDDLLASGVETEVIQLVKLVSNGPDVKGYAAYVRRCRDIVASGHRGAMRVKLADMLANEGHPTNDYTETIEIMRAGLSATAGA